MNLCASIFSKNVNKDDLLLIMRKIYTDKIMGFLFPVHNYLQGFRFIDEKKYKDIPGISLVFVNVTLDIERIEKLSKCFDTFIKSVFNEITEPSSEQIQNQLSKLGFLKD